MRSTARRGFFVLDAVTGLLILAALAVALTAALVSHGRLGRRLADTRAAVRLAERALIDPALDPPAGTSVRFRRIGGGPDDLIWVEAAATVDGRTAELAGLLSAVPPDVGELGETE